MQDLACCDYFRTPVNFNVPDIYRFVGEINGFLADYLHTTIWHHELLLKQAGQ